MRRRLAGPDPLPRHPRRGGGAASARPAAPARSLRGRARDLPRCGRSSVRATRRAAPAPVSAHRRHPARDRRLARHRESHRATASRAAPTIPPRCGQRAAADGSVEERSSTTSRALTTRSTRLPARWTRTPGTPGRRDPTQRMQRSRLTPGARLTLLTPVGERHRPGTRREAETDLAAGAEKRWHVVNAVAGSNASSGLASAASRLGIPPDLAASRTPARCATCCARSRLRRSVASSVARMRISRRCCSYGAMAVIVARSVPCNPAPGRRGRRRSVRAVSRARRGRRGREAPPLSTLLAPPVRITASARSFAV